MTKSILILGAGGHSKIVIETALAINLYDKISILDDKFTSKNKENNYILNHPIIGKFNKVLSRELKDLYNYAFVALGNSEERLNWLKILKQNNYKLPNLIHPRSYISKSSNFGKGILVAANASIQSSTKGNFDLIKGFVGL